MHDEETEITFSGAHRITTKFDRFWPWFVFGCAGITLAAWVTWG